MLTDIGPAPQPLQELLRACLELRRHLAAGQDCRAEDVLPAFPILAASPRHAVHLVCTEVLVRRARGELILPETWLQRFPQWRAELERQFRAVGVLPGGGGSTESTVVEVHAVEGLDLAAAAEELLAVHAELFQRLENGERPSLADYLQRFPEHADAIKRFWGRWLRGVEDSVGPVTPTALPLLPAAAAVPVLPGLEVYEKLGEGGMGEVYRARDVRLDRLRAIKLIRTGPLDGKARDRFNREAKAVARLDHPGVVRIDALGEHGGTLYICMELLEGGSLRDRLKAGPLEVRAAADLVRQLALAVQHAHEHHVLHRDLKPGNVLLTKDGTPKIGDFGLAKLLDTDDGLTQTGAAPGTPAYMAPEQADGRPDEVREPADVWALGVIFYEVLTGKRPFTAEGRSATLELVRTRTPAPPRRLRPEVPAELEAVCLRCLQKQPHRRYATAAALAADLQAWLDGKPPSVRAVPGRRRRLAAAAALALLAGLAGGAFWLLPGRPPQPVADPAPAAVAAREPGVWHSLLNRKPALLLWPTPGKNSRLRYDDAAQELVVSCEDVGLLGLGETAASHYRLALTLQQNPWAGNIGLFFGYRDYLTRKGEPARSYHYLELLALRQPEQGRKFRVDWRTVRIIKPGPEQFLSTSTRKTSPPFSVGLGEHRLELEVGAAGPAAVLWDGEVLPGLNARNMPMPPEPDNYRGPCGVYLSTGNGTFQKAEYLFSREP